MHFLNPILPYIFLNISIFCIIIKYTYIGSVENLGFDISDFGSHSFRKGVVTHECGSLDGPNLAAIFLRAGWSLGNVQDRYICYGKGADQLCGRVAAGLDINGDYFDILPPHFSSSLVITTEEWAEILPNYQEYPDSFQTVLPYLLASLVHHYDWICDKDNIGNYKNINKHHPILNSRLFTNASTITSLRGKLISNCLSSSSSGMQATGIPATVGLKRKIIELTDSNNKLAERLDEIADKLPEDIAENVCQKLKKNMNIQGVNQVM